MMLRFDLGKPLRSQTTTCSGTWPLGYIDSFGLGKEATIYISSQFISHPQMFLELQLCFKIYFLV